MPFQSGTPSQGLDRGVKHIKHIYLPGYMILMTAHLKHLKVHDYKYSINSEHLNSCLKKIGAVFKKLGN
jgi:hypothetical protein